MKYERSDAFAADYARLSRPERALFANAVRQINAAYESSAGRGPPSWPAALRMKQVRGASGVWELTWSFSGPDGRATFEFVTIEGELAIRCRRVGGHAIFREP